MGTRCVTTTALAAHLGSPPAYGESAAAVLETCALIAEAQEQWDFKQVIRFQEKAGIHEKVWGRLLAIHRCNRWQEVDQSDLPGNYTALFALTTLSDEAWRTLRRGKLLNKHLSSRKIQDWESVASSVAKAYRDRDNSKANGSSTNDALRQASLVLIFRQDQVAEVDSVLETLKQITSDRGMVLSGSIHGRGGSRGFGPTGTTEETLEVIAKDLAPLLKDPLHDAGKVLKDSLGIQTEDDLINASMRDFLKFINRAAGSSAAAMETYGEQYCLKLALEYNRMSNTRANRFNYKKKLEELAEHRENQVLKYIARRIYCDFIGEVRAEKKSGEYLL